ncbi:MAG: ROK family transcriptional regulator [Spirochaetales bacterium]
MSIHNSNSKISDLAIISLLNLLKDSGPLSQVELSNLSGYSRSTVSINCDKLLLSGYIVPVDNNAGQKKNIGLCLNKDFGCVIGIGMGGSCCSVALCDFEGNVLDLKTFSTDLLCGPEPILELICHYIDIQLKENISQSPLYGIGMGIPSPVKYEIGTAFHPAFMPGWHLYPIKDYLQSRYKCPTFVDNEVNTLALREYAELQESSCKVLLCIKVGTGIGAGIIINRNIYRGENGEGGNIGHIQVEGNQLLCTCGKVGCIESVASIPAIEQQATEMAQKNTESILYEIYKQKQHISITDIREATNKGDRYALEIIKEAGINLGNLLGKITVFLDPGKIIITGRISCLGPIYLDYIRREILKQASPWTGTDFTIEFSQLTDNTPATGAALLCIDELFAQQLIISKL